MKPVIALALLASAALVFTATTSAKHHHPKPPGIVGSGIGLGPAVNKHGIVSAPPAPQKTCNESGHCVTSGCKSPPPKKPKPRSSCSPQAPPRGPATNGERKPRAG